MLRSTRASSMLMPISESAYDAKPRGTRGTGQALGRFRFGDDMLCYALLIVYCLIWILFACLDTAVQKVQQYPQKPMLEDMDSK
jgi:hypothetical protein